MSDKVFTGCVLVIETEQNETLKCTDLSDASIVKKVFGTMKEAEQYIKNDALDAIKKDTFGEYQAGRDEKWGSNHFIVRVEAIVRPVPIMKPSVELMEVRP